jgi:Caspase domain
MLRGLLFLLLLVGLSAGAAHAERRVALLLGKSAYPDAPLDNPHDDVALLEQTLHAAGFEVEAHVDLGVGDIARIIDDFETLAGGSDVAMWRRPLLSAEFRPSTFEVFQGTVGVSPRWRCSEARTLLHGLTATSWEV